VTAEQEAGRVREIQQRLDVVHARIESACAAAGRARSEVTLVVVTKTFPADDVRLLARLGVRDVGENRDQEAAPKAAACADLPLTWHFVGRLQTNKAASVARYASWVHSVDRVRLVTALAKGAARAERSLDVLVQVVLDTDPEEASRRGGATPDDVPRVAAAVAEASGLRLRGVMAVAPLGEDPRAAFDRLLEVAQGLRRDHPTATVVSAGMSGDLEAAVAAGATHLRVGSAILGSRPPLH
jgi:pyridoxal phosphate enzyme (YggS family)